MFVVIAHNDVGLIVGKIKPALIHEFICFFHYWAVSRGLSARIVFVFLHYTYCCVAHEEILDYYPLTDILQAVYSILIIPHSIPTFLKNVFAEREYQRDYPQYLSLSPWGLFPCFRHVVSSPLMTLNMSNKRTLKDLLPIIQQRKILEAFRIGNTYPDRFIFIRYIHCHLIKCNPCCVQCVPFIHCKFH